MSSIHRPLTGSFTKPLRIGGGGQSLPRANLIAYNKNTFDLATLSFLDTIGKHNGPLQSLQYINIGVGDTGYFLNFEMLAAGKTITGTTKNGTTTLTYPSAGRLNAATGTLWDFTVTWSDGVVSSYYFCSKTAANAGIAYDVSGAGRHLTATGFSNITTVCASGRSIGSDALNCYGYTTTAFAPIPAQTADPTKDALGNALTYTGRAKYSLIAEDSDYTNATMPDCDECRRATGWEFGTENWAYNADGTAKTIDKDVLEENGAGLRFYFGPKGFALYSVDQIVKDMQIIRIVRTSGTLMLPEFILDPETLLV